MAMTDAPSRLLPLAEELLGNDHARDSLREGAEKLRAALASGRKRPKRTGRKVVLGLLVAVGVGSAAVLAVNEDLRDSVLGSAKALGEEISSSDGGPS